MAPSAEPSESDHAAESVARLNPVVLAATGLAVVFIAIAVVAATTLTGSEPAASAEQQRAAASSKLPAYWTVRKGDSFGSIAFRWGRTVPRLKQLNPKLKETALQPGDRVRLRK